MPTAGRKCEKGEFGSFYLLFSAKSKSPQVCEIDWDPDDRTGPPNAWRCPARGPLSLAAMANDVMSGDAGCGQSRGGVERTMQGSIQCSHKIDCSPNRKWFSPTPRLLPSSKTMPRWGCPTALVCISSPRGSPTLLESAY